MTIPDNAALAEQVEEGLSNGDPDGFASTALTTLVERLEAAEAVVRAADLAALAYGDANGRMIPEMEKLGQALGIYNPELA